jgi:hypothetical protein
MQFLRTASLGAHPAWYMKKPAPDDAELLAIVTLVRIGSQSDCKMKAPPVLEALPATRVLEMTASTSSDR